MWVLYNTYIVYKGSEVGVRNVDTWSISYTISTDLPGADHLDHSLSRDRYEIESDERAENRKSINRDIRARCFGVELVPSIYERTASGGAMGKITLT